MTLLVAREDEPRYGTYRAMVLVGKAKFVGERFDERGRKLIAIEDPRAARRNAAGTIGIGREFFTSALRDYEDWQEKWWREAIQNAVDAGAHNIECVVHEGADGQSYLVTCIDDGRGMDPSTLLDKFLVLGGTTKVGAGTTGGFGKAKELLLLPWLEWSVMSGETHVQGSGIQYEVSAVPHFRGTVVSVKMPADKTTSTASALAFIGKCHLPGVRFLVRQEAASGASEKQEVRAELRKGKLIRSFNGGASLYHAKKAEFCNLMLVRSNGLFMFGLYVSSGVKGQLIVELDRPGVEVLSANRDGFRDQHLRRALADYGNELAADTLSALKAKMGIVAKKFLGRGKYRSIQKEELEASLDNELGRMVPAGREGGGPALTPAQVKMIVQIIDGRGGGEQPERLVPESSPTHDEDQPAPPMNLRATGELVAAMLDGTKILGSSHIEAVAKQLAWEPDYYLVNKIEGWHVPRKFYPDRMAPSVRKLLRFWAEMCRFVLIQLGSKIEFGVGFVFAPDVGATYMLENDSEHWLMLNPFPETSYSGPTGTMYSPSKKDDIPWLYAAAVHEATHMADGIDYHNESFAAAFTRNVARTSGKTRQIERIRRAVVGFEHERSKQLGAVAAGARAAKQRAVAQEIIPLIDQVTRRALYMLLMAGRTSERELRSRLRSFYSEWMTDAALGGVSNDGQLRAFQLVQRAFAGSDVFLTLHPRGRWVAEEVRHEFE